MKKELVLAFLVFINLYYVSFAYAVSISEVELNPLGSKDNGNEWVELYSNEEINLGGWRLENIKGKNMSLNLSFSGYTTIIGSYQFLSDTNQKLKLYDSYGNLIDETDEISDKENNDFSWQLCNMDWRFIESSSKDFENNCANEENEENEEEPEQISEDYDESVSQEEKNNEEENEIVKKEEVIVGEKSNTPLKQETLSSKVIMLNSPEEIKINKQEVIYESKNEIIRKYWIYGFCLFLMFIIFILLLRR